MVHVHSSLTTQPGRDSNGGAARAWLTALACLFGLAVTSHAAPRPPWTRNALVGSPNPPSAYTVERVHPGVQFRNPVDFTRLPGTDRFMVAEQSGRLLSFRTGSGSGSGTGTPASQPELALDLRKHHDPFDSVLGFTFHPGFATNRFIFVNYNEPGGRENGSYISRFTLGSLEPPIIDPASERVIFRWLSGGHNGCTLEFGPDGFLYVSTGDAAAPDPPDGLRHTGQDIGDALSSILRLDVDRADAGRKYSVPRDNPFVSTPGAAPEVWAFGFRNPFRMSFDRATGDLWVGDVGWEQWEMIHRVKRGGNHGWSATEGPNQNVRPDLKPGPGPITAPVVALPHSEAASITGGRVYHGKRLPKLTGSYLYGDWETGKFWSLRTEGDRVLANDELCDTTLKPVCFAEDFEGEMLILDYGGGIHRFIPNPAPPANLAFPRRLTETGLFADTPAHRPAPGVVAYQPKASAWSDGAIVDHLVAVPGHQRISPVDGREVISGRMWHFPSNTVFARTLTLEMTRGIPSTRRRVETQVLHFEGQAWNAYSYRWNTNQTDAELVASEGTNTTYRVVDASAPGGQRDVPWRFVSRAECFRCHNVWAGEILSFNWPQLGPPKGDTESARLDALGVLEPRNPPDPFLALADPHDPNAPLEARARSWLHVNCAGCHRFGAGGGVNLQLNFDKPVAEARALDERPARGDFGLEDARIIARGDPWRSALLYRVNTEGTAHMPHVGSRLTDPAGAALLRDWIRSLPPGIDANGLSAGTRFRLVGTLDDPATGLPAVASLLGRMSGALALLDRIANSLPAVPAPVLDAAMVAARSHTNSLLRDLFQRILPPDQRRATLGTEFPASTVLALAGDAVRGQDVFGGSAQCTRCHVRDGHGRAFGPDLTGIGRKYPRDQLLEQITHPSKVIAPEYKTVSITLGNDVERVGFVVRRGATGLVLRDAELVEHAIRTSEIVESRESALSAMPEGILAALTPQEAADLLAYLLR